MSVLHAADLVDVSTQGGRPISMRWRGRRYGITDTTAMKCCTTP